MCLLVLQQDSRWVTKEICLCVSFIVFVGDVGTVTGVHAAFSNNLLCTRGCTHEFPPEQPSWNKGDASHVFFFFFFFLRIWVAKEGLEFLLRPNYSFHFKNAKNTLSLHTAGSRAVYLCVDHLFSTDMSFQFYWSRYKPPCLTHRYHSFHRFFLHRFLDLYCGVSNISLFLITRL